MSLTETINTDIKNAMKAREKEKLAAFSIAVIVFKFFTIIYKT